MSTSRRERLQASARYTDTAAITVRVAHARHIFLIFCLIALRVPAVQSQPQVAQAPDIDAALEFLDDNNIDEYWHFTMELLEEGEERIIRSDPLREKYARRQLVEIGGEPPSEKARQQFRKAEKKRIDEQDPETSGYSYLVDLESLELVTQRGEVLEFSFRPRLAAFEKAEGKMTGVLLFNGASNTIEKIEIRNTAELAPAFSVTVNEYRLSFLFGAPEDRRLLRKMESYAVGKAGFVKGFESFVQVDFSEYQRVADDPVKQVLP